MAKLLGLDVGEKRIGYAIGDTDIMMAFPRSFVERKNIDYDLSVIEMLCKEEKIEKIIIGEPLGEENEQTKKSKEIRIFGQNIERKIEGISILYVDESFSSQQALKKIPLKRDRRLKGSDDPIAAAIILERYMESM